MENTKLNSMLMELKQYNECDDKCSLGNHQFTNSNDDIFNFLKTI